MAPNEGVVTIVGMGLRSPEVASRVGMAGHLAAHARSAEKEVFFPCPKCGVEISNFGVPTHVDGLYCQARIARDTALARGLVRVEDWAVPAFRKVGATLEYLPTEVGVPDQHSKGLHVLSVPWGDPRLVSIARQIVDPVERVARMIGLLEGDDE